MNPLLSSRERDLTPANAIEYTLARIKLDPVLGWRMGFGTEVFAKLTQALAEATGKPIEDVRSHFAPRGLTEPILINWKDVSKEMPDADTVVLIHSPTADEPVWIGYHDGECWREVGSEQASNVTLWAHLPEVRR
ncbi:MAG: hypothetical protein ABS95_01175 [Verrucomicrobia bacterium SCN 57-15]|mgnify:CR=1 FL=1|nr:MAG: hypothetical protein ABS95_01175 [Verrucomicrobia bacterium SCN 57-15]